MTDPHQSPTHPHAALHPDANPLQRWLFKIIFGHHTRGGRAFDIVLLIAILTSVVAVSLETVEPIADRYGPALRAIEWGFTILFTIEYIVRLYCVREPARYARSFFGIVDLLAVLPTYLALCHVAGAQSLLVVRGLRLLRVFRILKLVHLMREGAVLRRAIWESRDKIVVFLSVVLVIVTIVGAAMYLIESPVNDRFSSIPQSVYWAIVTMTTVGYGDVVPITALGKLLSATLIIIGYSLIVVPTGFVTATMIERKTAGLGATTTTCDACGRAGHTPDAKFCKYCGKALADDNS